MAKTKASRRRAASERNHTPRRHLTPLERHAPRTHQAAPLRQRLQRPHSDLLLGGLSHHSQRLPPLPRSCRSRPLATRRLITDDPRLTTRPPQSLVATHKISAHSSHRHSKLHTIHSIMQMSTSDNSRHTLLSQAHSTATLSHMHTHNPHSNHLHLSNHLLRLRSRILDSSSSSSSQHPL